MNRVLNISSEGLGVAISGTRQSISCSQCSFSRMCLSENLADADAARLEQLFVRRRILRDASLYRTGDHFHSLYAVRYGYFKTVQICRHGEQSIGRFCMSGDLLGMEAIGTERHSCNAVALEDSEVYESPFGLLQELLTESPILLRCFHRAMSREIEREQSVMLFRSRMHADQRLAIFLLHLGERYAERGYSSSSFQLRMSREDIGGYLGLTVECVSRQMARLRQNGSIALHNRDLRIADRTQLEAVAAGELPNELTAA